jgi:plasmid replication initiation protein
MAKRKTEQQDLATRAAREMSVVKRDDMVQHARFSLSIQEQRCVLYAISKIKPEDTAFTEYTFELKDFYTLCGIEDQSYTRLKQTLKGLSDKSWWAVIDDKGTESLLRWFSTLRTNKRSGRVTVKFHEDMMPYLLQLATQAREQGAFYTQYGLKYVLPMRGQYSPRLYELLKSYQKNNREWFFDIDELKRILDCQKYKNFNDFKKRALDPAVEEINEYTDLNVAYDTERTGRGGRVSRVIFFLAGKSKKALTETNLKIYHHLDGQMSIEDFMEEFNNSVRAQFWAENPPERPDKPSEGF